MPPRRDVIPWRDPRNAAVEAGVGTKMWACSKCGQPLGENATIRTVPAPEGSPFSRLFEHQGACP